MLGRCFEWALARIGLQSHPPGFRAFRPTSLASQRCPAVRWAGLAPPMAANCLSRYPCPTPVGRSIPGVDCELNSSGEGQQCRGAATTAVARPMAQLCSALHACRNSITVYHHTATSHHRAVHHDKLQAVQAGHILKTLVACATCTRTQLQAWRPRHTAMYCPSVYLYHTPVAASPYSCSRGTAGSGSSFF